MKYWWVNQNGTYKFEVHGGFMWSPKTKRNGHKNQFYDFMKDVDPGDVVFSFCDTRIKAIGIATGRASSSKKPEFQEAGAAWADDGWLVPVEFHRLSNQIRPKDHMAIFADLLPEKYSPLQQNGDGLQSVYLTLLSQPMADELIKLIGPEYDAAMKSLSGTLDTSISEAELEADKVQEAIIGRTDIGPTTKDQLVKARRGQGTFRANVLQNEKSCRVTGTSDQKHLRASHIKPWAASNDEEKLHGCNGLMLAPHVDHLFDKGMISFSDKGDIIVSKNLDGDILKSWGIPANKNVGTFNADQRSFLAYHRKEVFEK